MTVTFTSSSSLVRVSPVDMVTSAMREIGVYDSTETPPAEDITWGLEKLQRIIDVSNVDGNLVYNVSFAAYPLQANHSPHTIGPSGDFDVPSRPVRIVSCSLVLIGSPNSIDIPMHIRDDAWWAQNAIKDLTSTLPTDLYYSPDLPLGNLYFWPIPTAVNNVRLETWAAIAQPLSATDKLVLPPAYWDYLIKTLAIELGPSNGVEPSLVLVASQQRAERLIATLNARSPRISTGAGMPGTSIGRPGFNFLTREVID